MLQTASTTNATQGPDRHRVAVLTSDHDPLLATRMCPHLMRAALAHDAPARVGQRIPDRLVLLRHPTTVRLRPDGTWPPSSTAGVGAGLGGPPRASQPGTTVGALSMGVLSTCSPCASSIRAAALGGLCVLPILSRPEPRDRLGGRVPVDCGPELGGRALRVWAPLTVVGYGQGGRLTRWGASE